MMNLATFDVMTAASPPRTLESTDTANPPLAAARWRSLTNVVLADYDPLSRHVLSSALRAAGGADSRLRLLASLDAFTPVRSWDGLHHAQVVVLAPCPQVDTTAVIRELVVHDVRVLLLATRWDGESLNRSMAAGASGCLVKDTDVDRIAAAALAVGSGYMVLSPELKDIYRPDQPQPGRPGQPAVLPLTEREHEVLNLLAEGLSTAETARALGVSPTTVKSHVSHALPKLNVRNRLEAVLRVKDAR